MRPRRRDDYELAAGSLLQQREDEWARTRSGWTRKEKELTDRATEAERERDANRSRASGDINRADRARSQAESKLAGVQSRLNSANQEIAQLRSRVTASNQRADEMLRTSSTDIRDWFCRQFASLPPLHSRHEIRIALRNTR